MIKILYRTSDDLTPINGIREDWCQEAHFKLKCFKSLLTAVKDKNTSLYLIGDCLKLSTIDAYLNLCPDLVVINSSHKLGNQGSLLQVFKLADSFQQDEDILYFCEDDYLYLPSFYDNIVSFFHSVGNLPGEIFFHPTDYPDQYVAPHLRRSYIFYNESGGWFREVDSTTFTFACKAKSYKKYRHRLKSCAVKMKMGYDEMSKPVYSSKGADDGRFSEIFGFNNPNGTKHLRQQAFCFCPLPGQASHMHKGTQSLHFDWQLVYNNIHL